MTDLEDLINEFKTDLENNSNCSWRLLARLLDKLDEMAYMVKKEEQ